MRDPVPSALRLIVEAALVVVAVVVWVGVLDTTQLPKAVVASLAGVMLLAIVGGTVVRGRAVPMPPRAFGLAVVAFLLVLAATGIASGGGRRAFTGAYARWTGVSLYVACAVLALATAAVYRRATVRRPALAVMAATGLAASYGVLQRTGADPIDWVITYEGAVFSSLGNPNFLAAFLGLGLPLWVMTALDGRRPRGLRASAAIGGLIVVLVISWTSSLQGLLVAGAGVWVLALVAAERLPAGARRRVRAGLVAGAVLVAATGAAGFVGKGPLAGFDWTTLRIRFGYWRAGIGTWLESPLIGAGPTGYADHFRRHRTVEEWLRVGTQTTNDSAHNVLIDMLASGGPLLALAYLGVLATVGWALVRAVRGRHGDPLLVGGLAGAWVAYVVQSLVSIDVPPLALTGWVLAGAVVALGSGETSDDLRLIERGARWTRHRVAALATLGVVTVLSLAGTWILIRQLQADSVARDARVVLSTDPGTAAMGYRSAHEIAPWEPRYPFGAGNALDEQGRLPEALAAYEAAAAVDPWWWDAHIAAARLSAFLGDLDRSAGWYERVLEIEPVAADMKFEAGRVEFLRGRPAEAVVLLEAAVEAVPDAADWWLLLAEARAAAGDERGADAAHARAVELDPSLGPAGG